MNLTHHIIDGNVFENCLAHLSGTIHDVKNLVFAAQNAAEIMKLEISDEHLLQKRLQTIIQVTQKCMELLDTLQTRESVSVSNFKKIELKPLIEDVVSWICLRSEKKVSFDISFEIVNPILIGNKTELEGALLNLCINALEAMTGEGMLRIKVYSKENNRQIKGSSIKIVQNTFINIDISDTGTGIAPEKIPFIFKPFFSTKQNAGGPQRGMGLYRTKNCICAHGGTIEVQSTSSRGTTFTIMLPVMGPH